MEIQQIVVWLFFLGSVFYMGMRSINTYRKKQCHKGCAGGCGTINLPKMVLKK